MYISEHLQPMERRLVSPTTGLLARCRKGSLKSSIARRMHRTRLLRQHTLLNIDIE